MSIAQIDHHTKACVRQITTFGYGNTHFSRYRQARKRQNVRLCAQHKRHTELGIWRVLFIRHCGGHLSRDAIRSVGMDHRLGRICHSWHRHSHHRPILATICQTSHSGIRQRQSLCRQRSKPHSFHSLGIARRRIGWAKRSKIGCRSQDDDRRRIGSRAIVYGFRLHSAFRRSLGCHSHAYPRKRQSPTP